MRTVTLNIPIGAHVVLPRGDHISRYGRVVGHHEVWLVVEYYGKTTKSAKRYSRAQTICRPQDVVWLDDDDERAQP